MRTGRWTRKLGGRAGEDGNSGCGVEEGVVRKSWKGSGASRGPLREFG